MNHNELAGWQHPAEILSQAVVILLRDGDEPERIGRRMDLTARSLASRAGRVVDIRADGGSLLARLFSLIYLGDWVSYYLAALNGVDPTPIESIEQLKSRLAGEKS
jgi:glucose/mannose-6-phosphate isomerase